LSGILSGPGAVVHNGSSTLTLSGANAAYTGAITVNKNSILLAGASGSLGTGTTTLMSGTLGASVNGLALNGSKLAVPSGTNGLVNMTAKMRLPALYGAGTLAVNVNSTSVTDPSNSGDSLSACANFTGTLNLTGQVANAQMSCFFNGGSFDGLLQNATVNLLTGGGGGVSLVGINNSGGNTAQIGALNVDSASSLGGSAYAGTQTYQIGALGGISDIEGAVIGNGAIIKVGSGTLLLNNSANTYTGKTTVSAGTLLVNGQITTSPITVGSGGKLSGTGIIGAPTTNSAGAILNPGNNNVGTLTFNNNLVLSATSTNRFVVTTAGGASNSVVVSGGTLIANNSVIAINTAGSATLGAGTNVLFTYSSISGSFNAAPVFDTAQTGPATAAFIYDNGSQIALVVPAPSVNTNPTNITAVVTGNSLSLTWPGDHLGWTLQTNSVDLANTNYWFAYPGSASVTNVNITINPAKTNVFFRLVYP
jgi:autotransporter-associated beta strand protein